MYGVRRHFAIWHLSIRKLIGLLVSSSLWSSVLSCSLCWWTYTKKPLSHSCLFYNPLTICVHKHQVKLFRHIYEQFTRGVCCCCYCCLLLGKYRESIWSLIPHIVLAVKNICFCFLQHLSNPANSPVFPKESVHRVWLEEVAIIGHKRIFPQEISSLAIISSGFSRILCL